MKVLCINDDFSNAGERIKYLLSVPKEMETYTIKEVVETMNGSLGYILEEVFAGFLPNGKEISFDPARFVPLQEIDTLADLKKEIQKLKELIDA